MDGLRTSVLRRICCRGTWLCDYAQHRQPFDEIKHRHALNEVGDVAEGRYDWKIEKGRGGISL